ncbi:MAG: U32 family peptidase [Myxococcales bacterium]
MTSSRAPNAKTMELLAPAGGVEAGLAAFQYGADAVYLGLKRFSARADADNFTLEGFDSLVGYAHSLAPRRRVFVTLNTLVLQTELASVARLIGPMADVGVDAVIVQDLGVLRLLRRHFPELELHASTQLAAHDRPGVEALARMGFKRVTLARELTLDEIRDCASVPGCEVETFLHGALCYSYSGLCLLSSHEMGRSGNRGRCAYPCRDRWRAESVCPQSAELAPEAKSGFAFSMKDLALGEFVPALRDAGVACLKIEGRKKSPLYVATTVDYYRSLVDGTLDPAKRAEREADLKAVFSRPWTKLFAQSNRDKDVADRDFVGHRGVRIGTVERVVKAGKTVSVRFEANRALSKHDGLQIDIPGLDRPFGFGVSDLRAVGSARGALEVPAGTHVDVPLPEDYPTIPEGAPIYCSSSQAVKSRFKVASPNLKAFRSRLPLHLEAQLSASALELVARVPDRKVELTQSLAGPFEPAKDAAKMDGAARAAFEKLGDTRFRLEAWSWKNAEGLFVPVSRLNEARRLLCEALEAKVAAQSQERTDSAVVSCEEGAAARLSREGLRWSIKVDRIKSLGEFGPEEWAAIDEVVVDVSREPLDDLDHKLRKLAERSGRPIRVALPMVSRGWESKPLEAKVALLRGAGFERWEAANASAFARLTSGLIDLATDWSVYVLNRLAAQQVIDWGATRFCLSPEDGLENMKPLLSEYGERAVVIAYQDTPLFVSESCPYANLKGGCPGPAQCDFERMDLVSSHGGKVLAINDRCRTWVVNANPFSLAGRLEALRQAGARSLRADFIHRQYSEAEVCSLFRRLRTGEPVAGHRGNFERGLGGGAGE